MQREFGSRATKNNTERGLDPRNAK